MKRDNYAIQVQQAQQLFLAYDQEKLIAKCKIPSDEGYLYPTLLGTPYRLNRTTGDLQRREDGLWLSANTHSEVMTLLDLICDSRDDRSIAGTFMSMQSFGKQVHSDLLEDPRDPDAWAIHKNPEGFLRAKEALGGEDFPGCDMGWTVELFDGLKIALQFWFGDEEFAPRLRFLWDANALQYLRYETMYFAIGLLKSKLRKYL